MFGLTFLRDHRPAGLRPAVTTIEIATQRQRLVCREAHHQCLTLKADSGWDRVGTGDFGTPIAIEAIGEHLEVRVGPSQTAGNVLAAARTFRALGIDPSVKTEEARCLP